METQLTQLNFNINGNNDSNDRNRRRIDDDITLNGLITSDRSLVMFLMMLGLYIDDGRISYAVKTLARIWQMCLLVFGGIGFCWHAFIYGGHSIGYLYDELTSLTSKRIGIYIGFGDVLHDFVVPLVQVTSLMYGINNFYKHLDRPVNAAMVSPLLALCKRNALIYFTCMALLVIAIDPISMTRSWYETELVDNLDDGDLDEFGEETYSLFVFNRFTTILFFNLSITCYLSVILLFTSLTMMHINAIQEEVVSIVSASSSNFELDKYLEAKTKITSLKNGSYFSTQLLTFTAAINIICFMFQLWFYHYSFNMTRTDNNDDYVARLNYSEVLVVDFYLLPYLLKGSNIPATIIITIITVIVNISMTIITTIEVLFFFYTLYRASAINTLHDKIVDIANDKYWEISQRYNSSGSIDLKQLCDYLCLKSDYLCIKSDTYAVFKLGLIEVRRGRLVVAVVGFLLYCLYILLMVSRRV